jgi:PAS domain-containing protein
LTKSSSWSVCQHSNAVIRSAGPCRQFALSESRSKSAGLRTGRRSETDRLPGCGNCKAAECVLAAATPGGTNARAASTEKILGEMTDSGWEGLFWEAFKRSRNAMVLADSRRCVVEVNGAFLGLLGYRRSELVGRPIYEFVAGGLGFQRARLETADRAAAV